jgi:hypothetical protein
MNRLMLGVFAALAMAVFASAASAGPFDGVLKGMEDSVNRRTQEMGQKAVDKTFDKAESCAAGDEDCIQRKQASQPAPAAAASVARCLATDVDCLQTAKKNGQTVEIVDESEVDTIRCSMSDTACMQRAKSLGKKVELAD